jgi:hypothetical protein
MLRRCGCGEPLPNPFSPRCHACASAGFGCYICGRPALGQTFCEPCGDAWGGRGDPDFDLDDDSQDDADARLEAEQMEKNHE